MNTEGNEPLLPKSDSNTWTAVSKTLHRLGFKMEGSDMWAVLGINKMEGPMPSQEDLNNRFHIAQSIAMLALGESSPLDSKARAQLFLELAQSAFHACMLELPQVVRERKKSAKACLEWRWME